MANSARQDRDVVIVHLTDLHFASAVAAPNWADAMRRALAGLAGNPDINILGLAVTGDLVDGPESGALPRVRESLAEWATALGLVTAAAGPQPDWERIWTIDGNHDYRKWGLFRLQPSEGIAEGGLLNRMQQFKDPDKRVLIFGLNSSKRGPAARGRVELDELRTFQARTEADDAAGYRYRVALIHHHLLPLPGRPNEFDGRTESIKRVIYDEAFKLLENAGLATEVLLRGSVDLVLHGHEHKEFSASVNYHDRRSGSRVMAVVGGPAAKDGFQVVAFRKTGDLDLVRYKLGNLDYEEDDEIRLWTYDDWKRAEWDRQRRRVGYNDRAELTVELHENGDLRQTSDISDIYGGERPIHSLTFSGQAGDETFGRVALDAVHDKQTGQDVVRSALPPSGPRFGYVHTLQPSATATQPHRGVRAARISRNNMALTQEDAALIRSPNRGGAVYTEHLDFSYQYPVRRLTYLLNFPPLYAPQVVNVSVHLLNKPGNPEDTAETLRAQRKLVYRRNEGFVLLDLDWLVPSHEYRLSWELPTQERMLRDYDSISISQEYIRRIRAALAEDAKLHDATKFVLKGIRERCFDHIVREAKLQRSVAGAFNVEQDDVSLWAFDSGRNVVRLVAGTYGPASPFLNAQLQYGSGIRGSTMKRGTNEFYRAQPQARHADFYHHFDGCPAEQQLFCVPIPLVDWPGRRDRERPASLGRCWMVACVASFNTRSIWHHLTDAGIRDKAADLLLFEVLEFVKEIVPQFE